MGFDGSYQNFELPSITDVTEIFKKPQLVGLNVTIPYKEAILPYLDELDETAKAIGAVNCIHLKNEKKVGYNTDAFGFAQMLKPFLETHHERALILGKGGSSKAVSYVLNQLGVRVFFVTRKPVEDNDYGYSDINDQMISACGIIVNSTPLGMFPDIDQAPEIPYHFLTSKHLCVDLIYNPKETRFMKMSKDKGATAINGETMLHQQAERSWEIWNS